MWKAVSCCLLVVQMIRLISSSLLDKLINNLVTSTLLCKTPWRKQFLPDESVKAISISTMLRCFRRWFTMLLHPYSQAKRSPVLLYLSVALKSILILFLSVNWSLNFGGFFTRVVTKSIQPLEQAIWKMFWWNASSVICRSISIRKVKGWFWKLLNTH